MKLSVKRRMAIYSAVHERLFDLRVALSLRPLSGDDLDVAIAEAMDDASAGAVLAAEGKPPRESPKPSRKRAGR